jgi:pimeloyl-ACP methyl ester carboxylesterase
LSRSRSRRQDNDHDHHHRDDSEDDDDENDEHNVKQLPLIFLHGIAPGGLFFYIPMLFFLGGDGRPLLFFENPDISFYILGGYPPNERETVVSVWEAVDTHLGTTQEVCLIGHSFGSCPITWLLHSSECLRIRQIVLVDPVSILLSEPDVVQNFLYQRHCLRKRKMPIKIGVVSNEIFTEHYLRRHFSWYNSELWLEDLPDHAKVLVCLSNDDSIVPSQKVHREVLRKPDVDILVWENAGHAHCVTRPRTWKQIQMLMKRQEQRIFQEASSTSEASPESSSSSSTTLESITIDNNLTVTTPAREKKIT